MQRGDAGSTAAAMRAPGDARTIGRTRPAGAARWVAPWALGLAALGCDADAPVVPAPSRALFDRAVYPILLRDCGFAACHGDPARAYHLYGPGRLRLDPETPPLDPPTAAERRASYERSRAMLLRPAGEPEGEALLLRKPLAGAAHRGLDEFGDNVYADADDPSHAALAAWAAGAEDVP